MMFRGETEMKLNQETVIEALQEYFDKRLVETDRVKVMTIKVDTGYDNGFKTLVIVVKALKDTPIS